MRRSCGRCSPRGVGWLIACGMNPRYGDFDTYHMAASAIDEAMRNCVAVGADPARIAILDNFCWGDCERPETLGSLVRAALACHDVAMALGTPFISGKDSLNNEFRYTDAAGAKQIDRHSAVAVDQRHGANRRRRRAVTMDLKDAGNLLYQVGATKDELGGSHFALVEAAAPAGKCRKVESAAGQGDFRRAAPGDRVGLVRACHDLSEGGLAVAAAEMAFAGGLGGTVFLEQVPHHIDRARRGCRAVQPCASSMPRCCSAESNTPVSLRGAAGCGRSISSRSWATCLIAAIGEVLAEPRLQIVSADPGQPVERHRRRTWPI